jgi:dTMP kinase
MFITFEGPDGSGKTTQARMLVERLRQRGYDVLLTREPGGTEIGDQIRAVLHDSENTAMDARTEILLYSASRAQHVAQLIRPALAAGKIVVSDRYADSTYAYQGYGRGLDLEMLRMVTQFATDGLMPDLTIYLDLSPEEGLRRRRAGDEEWNRLDGESLAFHRRVHAGYQELIRRSPGRWVVVDAVGPVEALCEAITTQVTARMRARERGPDG